MTAKRNRKITVFHDDKIEIENPQFFMTAKRDKKNHSFFMTTKRDRKNRSFL